jgi:hypothetical protein
VESKSVTSCLLLRVRILRSDWSPSSCRYENLESAVHSLEYWFMWGGQVVHCRRQKNKT